LQKQNYLNKLGVNDDKQYRGVGYLREKTIVFLVALVIVLSLSMAAFGLIFKTQNRNFQNDPLFYKALGGEYVKLGENGKAISAYEECLTFGEDLEAHSNLAVLYYREGKYSEAISNLIILTESEPANPSYHYDLAVNLVDRFRNTDEKSLDDLYEALAEYERAEQLLPGYSYAAENIAVLEGILKIE
jgi:tetratricopeptide (TPR) repeat protein